MATKQKVPPSPAVNSVHGVVGDTLRTAMAVTIVGTTPLIVHNWSEKAKREMRDRQSKAPRQVREAKNPEAEFQAAKYRSHDGSFEGVPAHGLKGAIVEGARFVGGSKELNMTTLKSALYVAPDCQLSNLLRLYAPPATMREDLVRVGSGMAKTVDLRYRPTYWPWAVRFVVAFPRAMFQPNQILDLIRAGGAFNGFCEWRPGSPLSRTGQYGTFEVATQLQCDVLTREYGSWSPLENQP